MISDKRITRAIAGYFARFLRVIRKKVLSPTLATAVAAATVSLAAPGNSDDLTRMIGVSAGEAHTCSLDDTGQVWCWGRNDDGQLGIGNTVNQAAPVRVPGMDNVKAIATGHSHTCAITQQDIGYCWGSNTHGQLGTGTTDDSLSPVEVHRLGPVSAISAGRAHTCAINARNQRVRCWGHNNRGQVGDGTTITRLRPTPVPAAAKVRWVRAGWDQTCVTRIRCWGNGRLEPTRIWRRIRMVTNGRDHTCDIRRRGYINCQGSDVYGQTGIGNIKPVVTHISAGRFHTCAITLRNSYVMCWGNNEFGQLGDGSTETRAQTARVKRAGRSTAITTGGAHSCVITELGTVRCWGRNEFGELGDGTMTQRLTAVELVFAHDPV